MSIVSFSSIHICVLFPCLQIHAQPTVNRLLSLPQPTIKPSTMDDSASQHRKGSILRAASALASGMDEREDITYVPLRAWTKQSNTEELIHDKVVKRERFGWEVDFPDFQMPFNKNVSTKMVGMDDDD